jgi:hypothetical protein
MTPPEPSITTDDDWAWIKLLHLFQFVKVYESGL